MRNSMALLSVGALVLALAVSIPMADEHGKCSHDTQSCLNYMASQMANRGWAGVELDGEDGAFTINKVYPDTPAAKAGVKVGDQLVAINGIRVGEESDEARSLWSQMKAGNSFDYTLRRQGKERNVRLTLTKMPEEEVARIIGAHMMSDHATVELAQN